MGFVADVERSLAQLRHQDGEERGPLLRTSVMTHIAWLPRDWVEAGRATLAGLRERHPSRTILLLPEPDAGDEIEIGASLECFPLEQRQVCSEVIELRLRGRRARAPASVVTPLLIFDLPVFLRWRGLPPFGEPELEQLVGVADRLVLDSREWADPAAAYAQLTAYFERIAVSDIAWARMLGWRRSLAGLWPSIKRIERLSVAAPLPEAVLLAGWLRSRLRREVELVHDPADEVEFVAVDGEAVAAPLAESKDASDLLSDELDTFGRDRIYEDAVRAVA